MKEGTIFVVLGLPGAWPPAERVCLFSAPQNESLITLLAYQDGHLEFLVDRDGKNIVSYQTQPISISESGLALFDIVWNSSMCSVHIGGREVPSSLVPPAPFHVSLKPRESRDPISLENPAADTACAKWIRWRSERFAVPKKHEGDYLRDKELSEQVEELTRAIDGLEHLLHSCVLQKQYLIDYLAAGLRALVYWDDGRKYNPILLRIAARIQPPVPLPVFAFPEEKLKRPEIINKANYHYEGHEIHLWKLFPGQELMDLQEWLDSAVQIERFGDELNTLAKNQERVLKARDVVLQCASTVGVGHYHEYVQKHFDKLRKIRSFNTPLLFQFLVSLSQVTIELGRYVLSRARKAENAI